jgi:hypothetical protein
MSVDTIGQSSNGRHKTGSDSGVGRAPNYRQQSRGPPDLRSIGGLLVVGISLNAGPFMSYSKSRPCPIAPWAVVGDPDRSVDSPMRVASITGPAYRG